MNYTVSKEAASPVIYSLKIIPKKKADFRVMKLHGLTGKYSSIDGLKEAICEACKDDVTLEAFGYIEPGHGAKGKERWLVTPENLRDMYAIHGDKKEVLLWCYTADQGQKR